jgi:hypothetical protein
LRAFGATTPERGSVTTHRDKTRQDEVAGATIKSSEKELEIHSTHDKQYEFQ